MAAAYTVHEPIGPDDPVARAERIAFVKEGFSWPALLFAPLWLIYHRMWLVLVAFLAVASLVPVTLAAYGLGETAAGWMSVAIVVLFALHANDLRRWTLARRRYRMAGAVSGRDREECEYRFFSQWAAELDKGRAAPDRELAGGFPEAASARSQPEWRAQMGPVSRPGGVVIVDYGSGNLHSAAKAFERAARESGAGLAVTVSADPAAIVQAERIVLPGVGAFADCMNGLKRIDGMVEALEEAVRDKGRPFLGICVGMQLMADRGLEHVATDGLGWIPGEVRRIAPGDARLKIPHMGWNTLTLVHMHPLLDGIALGPEGPHAYFVHSYHLVAADRSDVVAETDHGGPVTAMVARANMVGTQFHPEKSQVLGLALIANFLKWRP